jgi:hypothetical protein
VDGVRKELLHRPQHPGHVPSGIRSVFRGSHSPPCSQQNPWRLHGNLIEHSHSLSCVPRKGVVDSCLHGRSRNGMATCVGLTCRATSPWGRGDS